MSDSTLIRDLMGGKVVGQHFFVDTLNDDDRFVIRRVRERYGKKAARKNGNSILVLVPRVSQDTQTATAA